jgi:predicted ribosome quality control (RQC) complex YloA/Tae2 family protein
VSDPRPPVGPPIESGRFWAYELPGDWQVLAGRTEADNDLLSTRLLAPEDYWFHARDLAGSHVLLRARPDAEPDKDTLKAAAAIAAYHSKGRAGGLMSVSVARGRDVRKPRGAKPGLVHIRDESSLRVRPAIPHPAKTVRLPA